MRKKKNKKTSVLKAQEAMPKVSRWERIREGFFRYLYIVLYVAMLIVIWAYVIYNWEKCISMQFFSQFDGNNILFLAGLALIILPFCKLKIEVKGVKMQAEMLRELQNAGLNYEIHLQKGLLSDNENRKEDN